MSTLQCWCGTSDNLFVQIKMSKEDGPFDLTPCFKRSVNKTLHIVKNYNQNRALTVVKNMDFVVIKTDSKTLSWK